MIAILNSSSAEKRSSLHKDISLNKENPTGAIIDSYKFNYDNMTIGVDIVKDKNEYVPIYQASVATISRSAELVLEKIRNELIANIKLGPVDSIDASESNLLEKRFTESASILIRKYFPDLQENEKDFLTSYLVQKSLGFGSLQLLLGDALIEEIVINSATEPVWIFHKKHGWLKTNIVVGSESESKRYATMVGRKVGRQISILEPMLDANLEDGSRVNATFAPISITGNTLTFRKFSTEPLTITHFLEYNAINIHAAALLWHAIHYEMSILISGGTASGKTSMLNVLANFFPPNQRILTIEDTREIKLPKHLHWVPLLTRMPNPEGKGEVTMGDLLVNSLRMRPDRIIVGEVRRKKETETLFEAIHTGHSCYATIHANDVHETMNRLLNPPLDVPKAMLPAISLIINQYRNRRTGMRRTFQIAEINKDSSITVLMQYDPKKDVLNQTSKSSTLMHTFQLFSGQTETETNKEIKEKEEVLKYLLKNKIKTIDGVGKVISEYYMNKDNTMKLVKANKLIS